jgi:hypothetical protein
VLEHRLRLLSFPPTQPWVWIRTAEPCPDRGDVRLLVIAQVEPRPADPFGDLTDVPMGPGSLFTGAWSGYHYEAIGRPQRYHSERRGVGLVAEPAPGRPPMLMLRLGDQGAETLEAALWWQCAYKPAADGGEPPIVAVLNWRPGGHGARQGFDVLVPGDAEPTVRDFKAALKGRACLIALQRQIRSGGRTKGWRAGRPLTGETLIEWYRESSEYYADTRTTPTLRDLAQVLQVRSHNTAKRRWEEKTGLPWPPSATLLDDLGESVI